MPQIAALPQELTFIIATVLIVAAILALSAIGAARTARKKLRKKNVELATIISQLSSAEAQLVSFKTMQDDYHKMLESRTKALTERDEACKQTAEMREERDRSIAAKSEAEQFADEAEHKAAITQMQSDEMHKRMSDWERQKEESVQSARAAILKAGGEMSSKLLEDHKREAEQVKQQQTEQTRQTTEKLMTQFTDLTKTVATIRHDSQNNKEQMNVVMRALTNPAGVGRMAEIGLENSLKNMGLEPNRDFIMQYHISANSTDENVGALRPDAVIFLPQDVVMVVDSKASKHLLELAEAEGTNAEEKTLQALKRTMNEHLRTLASKNYKDAVLKSFQQAGKGKSINQMFNVMYVPSESIIEKMRQADSDFHAKCEKANVLIAGPTGMQSLFFMAKEQIASVRRDENSVHIHTTVEQLLESIAMAFGHVDKVGASLKSSLENFEKFARSANRTLIPRMNKLNDLGVTPAKNKAIPAPLATYDIRRIDDTFTLEANNRTNVLEAVNDPTVTPIKQAEEA